MQLHDHVQTVVLPAQVEQNGGLVALGLLQGHCLTGKGLPQSLVGGFGGNGPERNVVKTVVAGPAAVGGEELQALGQGVADLRDGAEFVLPHGGRQLFHVGGKAGLGDIDGLVRAEGGADLELYGFVGGDLLVPLQGVDGVVGGADEGNVRLLDEAPDGEVGVIAELFAGQLPHLVHGGGGQVALVAEELPQFQVAPVVHGVADGQLQSLGELPQPLNGGLVSRDVAFADAGGAHNPPFIVVAEVGAVGLLSAQPHLHQVIEPAVFVDLPGRNVAVVVNQGHGLGIVVKQMLRGFGFQQEILVHELLHLMYPS